MDVRHKRVVVGVTIEIDADELDLLVTALRIARDASVGMGFASLSRTDRDRVDALQMALDQAKDWST